MVFLRKCCECERAVASVIRTFALFPLPLIILCFPVFIVVMGAVGFLFGFPITGWYGIISFFICVLLAYYGGGTRKTSLLRLCWFIGIIFLVFLIDNVFVAFSWWDAQAYHTPAAYFLAHGWNPVFDATRQELLDAVNCSGTVFNAYHVAHLPRGGWIYNAVVYKITGNIESGDTLILLTAIVSGFCAWRTAPVLFGLMNRWLRFLFTSLIMFAPGFVASAFCGAQDGSLYCLMAVTLLCSCLYRKTGNQHWLGYITVSIILCCNLKFTGAITAVLSGLIFTIPILWSTIKKRFGWKLFRHWIYANVIGFFFAGVVGFSPYITNWANYGGPFYPQHSFNSSIVLPAITADFDLVNDDAAQMGFIGRTVNAYFSKTLAHKYYSWKLGHKFQPVFHLDQVGGLGSAFRVVMCLTLLLLFFSRKISVPWLIIVIVASSFMQPARFIGYVRYVPQLWMFPVLIAFNAITVDTERFGVIKRSLGWMVLGALTAGVYGFTLLKVVMSLIVSEYSLSILNTMQKEALPRAYVLSLKDRYLQDGRCMDAWNLLPKDLPSPRLFNFYYKTLLAESFVDNVAWQSSAQAQARVRNDEVRFYLGEHLWVWPQNPTEIRHPEMSFYVGFPKRSAKIREIPRLFCNALSALPQHLCEVSKYRYKQWEKFGMKLTERSKTQNEK